MKRRFGFSRPMPAASPSTQPSSSETEVISTVTQAPLSNWPQPAQTGEKSSPIVVQARLLTWRRCR